MGDHDPFNEPKHSHPRARELMVEEFFWDCVDELAPFGSDEGWDAYYEWRDWRQRNPSASLRNCLAWISDGNLDEYNESLCETAQVERDMSEPDKALLAEHFDMFTLDTTIIATGLGQLIDEGRIDAEAKPFINVALRRQSHPLICEYDERRAMLDAIKRVVQAA